MWQTIKFISQIDVAVIEVGCGGEYDATNVIRYFVHFCLMVISDVLKFCPIIVPCGNLLTL
jgi:folylpolyglutamate synthase/dihydropteroate synthase